jgi:hypothetical protein
LNWLELPGSNAQPGHFSAQPQALKIMFFFPKNRLVDHHVPDGFHQNVDPFWLPRYPTPRWFLTEKNGEISL